MPPTAGTSSGTKTTITT
jgi:hypothetical protein